MNFEQAMKDVQDTLVVMTEIQRRQSEVRKLQAGELDAMREVLRDIRKGFERHEKRMEQHETRMEHVEQNLVEITDKLNGLIGYMDGLPKQPPQ